MNHNRSPIVPALSNLDDLSRRPTSGIASSGGGGSSSANNQVNIFTINADVQEGGGPRSSGYSVLRAAGARFQSAFRDFSTAFVRGVTDSSSSRQQHVGRGAVPTSENTGARAGFGGFMSALFVPQEEISAREEAREHTRRVLVLICLLLHH